MSIKAPFEIQPISLFVRKELERRERDVGFNFIDSQQAGWDTEGTWNTYKGPMRCWVRVCSNGIGDPKYGSKEGFVMHGVNGFYNDYGFDPITKAKTQTVLGYTPSGEEHKIVGEYSDTGSSISKHSPPPGIMSIDVALKGNIPASYRTVTIKWKCHSKDHLNYLTPYFMTPGVSTFIEWGWNHFNPSCLLNLTDIGSPSLYNLSTDAPAKSSANPEDPRSLEGSGLLGIYTDPWKQEEKIETGRGLYELTCGIITSFEYSLQADGSYDCTTVVSSNAAIYSGTVTKSTALASTSKADDKGNKSPAPVQDLKTYINSQFKNLPRAILDGLDTKNRLFEIDGWPEPETRIFIPRNVGGGKDPRDKISSSTSYSFDNSATDHFWISMGLFVDLINKFTRLESGRTGATFNQIDIKSSWIGGHKNMISTNAKVLLIPNSQAPNISPDAEVRGKSSNYSYPPDDEKGVPPKPKSEADKTLESVMNGNVRQDLNEIVNFFRHYSGQKTKAETEFPSNKYEYYLGKLENLYIHKDVVIDAVNKSETVTDILNFVLSKVSECVKGMWKFNVIQYGGSNSLLTIIDSDAINVQRLQELSSDQAPYLYSFKNRAVKNTLQSFNFTVKLSDKVAQTVLQNYKSDDKVTVPIKNAFGFNPTDRLYRKTQEDSYLTPKDREIIVQNQQNIELERKREDGKKSELLNKEKDNKTDAFIYGEVYADNTSYIRKLALTQLDLFTLLVNDKDPKNASVNSVLQPGIKAEITLLGIAGFKTFQIFAIDNLPTPYDKDILFQVLDVKHTIQGGNWTTTVTAGLRPIKSLNTAPPTV
jgi:hypothetical protein